MIKRPNNKGETIIETIVALAIMAIGVTIAATVIVNSLRNMTNAKNRIVAVNIAREGVEAMRNIRDTNWLFYSDRRRACWNHDQSQGTCDPSTPTAIEPGTYIVYRNVDNAWRLMLADNTPGSDTTSPPDGDTENDLDLAPLSLVDVDLATDSDGDGDATNDLDTYNHMEGVVTNPLGQLVRPTAFNRYIVVEYMANDPANHLPSQASEPFDAVNFDSVNNVNEWDDAGNTPSELNRMRITSVVEWVRGSARHSAELKTIITDHLGREELSS